MVWVERKVMKGGWVGVRGRAHVTGLVLTGYRERSSGYCGRATPTANILEPASRSVTGRPAAGGPRKGGNKNTIPDLGHVSQ